jgi:hypothetical protein
MAGAGDIKLQKRAIFLIMTGPNKGVTSNESNYP